MIDRNFDITGIYGVLESLSTWSLARIDGQLQNDYWRAVNERAGAAEQLDDLNLMPFDARAAGHDRLVADIEDYYHEANILSLMISRARNKIAQIGRERAAGAEVMR